MNEIIPVKEPRALAGLAAKPPAVFNHGKTAAAVEYQLELAAPARRVSEILTGAVLEGGRGLTLALDIPAGSVRVYRMDY